MQSQPIEDLCSASALNDKIRDRLTFFLKHNSPEYLTNLQPFALAKDWQTNPKDTLDTFIIGAAKGLFELHWRHYCPMCENNAGEHHRISELPEADHCRHCDMDFVNALDETVEVTFAASPNLFEYDHQSISSNLLNSSPLTHDAELRVTGKDCLHSQYFREHFGDDVLLQDQSVQVKHIAILFTDIRSSTEMYEALGDVKAFKAVREHFDILFSKITQNNGVVVKTIGDAVMASFGQNADALKAAEDTLCSFPHCVTSNNTEVVVKMGLHSGPCLAVNLNNQIDYFGKSVNLAARIQGVANGSELVISDAIMQCRWCADKITEMGHKIKQDTVDLKGIGPMKLYILQGRNLI